MIFKHCGLVSPLAVKTSKLKGGPILMSFDMKMTLIGTSNSTKKIPFCAHKFDFKGPAFAINFPIFLVGLFGLLGLVMRGATILVFILLFFFPRGFFYSQAFAFLHKIEFEFTIQCFLVGLDRYRVYMQVWNNVQ